jgi:hypothetical protein
VRDVSKQTNVETFPEFIFGMKVMNFGEPNRTMKEAALDVFCMTRINGAKN